LGNHGTVATGTVVDNDRDSPLPFECLANQMGKPSQFLIQPLRSLRPVKTSGVHSVRLSRWFFDNVCLLEHVLRPAP